MMSSLANRQRLIAPLLLAVVVPIAACAPGGRSSVDEKSQATSVTIGSDDDAVLAVSAAIRKAGLVRQQDECLTYSVVERDAAIYEIQVRENHTRAECEGDPNTSPRLFEVRVVRETGAMTTNAQRDPEDFQPLPRAQ